MKAVALYVNLGRPRAAQTVERISEIATRVGVRIAVCDGGEWPHGFPASCDFEDAEMLLTVGGDGTLLRGARIAHPRGLPILGVNTGRLGFLTEIEADEDGLGAIERVLREGARIEERVALHARVDGVDTTHFAINDVVVRRGAQARLVPFGLVLDGEAIAHIPSDGVIVATPMGSTGYFLSAGGPIVHPRVDALGVAGLMPHTLFARPLLVPSAATIEITCDDEIARANLETDGVIAADLQPGARVVIRRAPKPALFARARAGAFFKRLEDKLQWGVPIKR